MRRIEPIRTLASAPNESGSLARGARRDAVYAIGDLFEMRLAEKQCVVVSIYLASVRLGSKAYTSIAL